MAKKVVIDDEILQSVYINPLTDFGFKKLFLNKELLIAFLNDVVGTDIKDITYLPTEGLGEYKEERATNFDLLCTNDKDEFFIVEMQLGHQTHFRERVLFYASQVIRKQGPRKKRWDFKLKAVYVVSILNFVTFNENSAEDIVIERVSLFRETHKTQFSEKLKFIFIELPKFKKKASELKNNTDIWLYLLKNTFSLKACPPEIKGKTFKLFLEIAEIKRLTPKEMETYQKSLKNNYYVLDIANYARMEGRMEGEMKGRMEGRMEGEQIGVVKEKKQFALKLLKKGTPVEEVIDLTELSKEQVMELLHQLPIS